MNIIPAIDLRNGSCVRLHQGDFGKQTEYSARPCDVARDFEKLGFNRLHIVDLDGARSGTQAHQCVIAEIAARSSLAIQIGGGIRDARTLEAWLNAGATRCVVGSVAVTNPDMVRSWISDAHVRHDRDVEWDIDQSGRHAGIGRREGLFGRRDLDREERRVDR
jgi:phosphoribosylformimino-5-aminoimidazole carboxamide ribotide isomerase